MAGISTSRVPVFQEKKQLPAFQVEQVQVGQTPAGLVKTCDWLEVSPSRVSRLDESILFVLASWPDATPKPSSFFCEYWGKQFPFNFRVRASFAKNIHVWRPVPVWLESRFDLAILLGHLALWMEIRHQAACRVYCEFSFLCVCGTLCLPLLDYLYISTPLRVIFTSFSAGLLCDTPTRVLFASQSCTYAMKQSFACDSTWFLVETSSGLLRHTDEDSRRVAIFRQERETKVPIVDAEFDWSCNWMIWILVRFQLERGLGFGL